MRKALESDSKDSIKSALESFQQKMQKLGEVIYKQQQEGAGAGQPPPPGPGQPAGGPPRGNPDEPVDADFEVKA